MDQSLGWRRSCSYESHTPNRACYSSMPTGHDPRLPALRCTTSGWDTSSHQKFCHTHGGLLTRATFSRRFGVCSLSPPARSLPQELDTLLGLCLCVAKAKSGMLREPCGALWGVVLIGPQLGQHGRRAVADDGVFSLPSRCAGAQKTSTSPTFHRSAPEQPLAVQVTFSFCGLRMMLRGSV